MQKKSKISLQQKDSLQTYFKSFAFLPLRI